jgi:hypothetical protein
MAKKLRLNDALVSLYGVPFEEALAGVLAVKPPEPLGGVEQKKSGRKKKTPAAPDEQETVS